MRPLRPPLALLVLLGALVPAGIPPLRPAGAEPETRVADVPYPESFRSAVRRAIAKGVERLRTEETASTAQHLGGEGFVQSAAVTWVLERAGLPASDLAFGFAMRRLRFRPPHTVEEASLLVLALCALPLPAGDPFSMEERDPANTRVPALAPEDAALLETTVRYLVERQVPRVVRPTTRASDDGGGWDGLSVDGAPGVADVPSTYLALLALESASRRGVRVPIETYASALDLLLRWQAPDGPPVRLRLNEVRGSERLERSETARARGFWFFRTQGDRATGYETAAGAVALVVCQDALRREGASFPEEARRRTRSAIRDALAWIQSHYDIRKNPVAGHREPDKSREGSLYHHRWLQALARLAVHARMRYVGTHDWYREGAEELLKTQREDGSWGAIWWANCYALLFLMRASLPSTGPVVTEGD